MKKGFNQPIQKLYQISLNNLDTMLDYLINVLGVCPSRVADEINHSFVRARRRNEARDK